MKLGMNMLLWSPDVTPPAYQPTFELLKDIGYEGVEIPILDREVDKYAELGARLGDLGLERVAVAARGAGRQSDLRRRGGAPGSRSRR